MKRKEDEYIFSWLKRNANSNSMSLKEFLEKELGVKNKIENVSILNLRYLVKNYGENSKQLILDGTPFGALAPFMSNYSKDAFIKSNLDKEFGVKLFEKTSSYKLVPEYKICPECYKKGIVKNVHLLPGVSCCPEHNYKLITIGKRLDDIDNIKLDSVAAEKEEIKFAKYAEAFNKLKPEIQINEKTVDNLKTNFTNEINRLISVCDDPKNISKHLKAYKQEVHLTEFVCEKCGAKYLSSEFGNRIYGCPNCCKDKTDIEILKKLTKNTCYEIIGNYTGLTNPILVIKNKSKMRIQPKRILNSTFYNGSNINDKLNKFEGFVVLSSYSSSSLVECIKCHKQYWIQNYALKQNTYCRICEKEKRFKQLAKQKTLNYPKDKLDFLGYNINFTNGTFVCKECGYEFRTRINHPEELECPWCNPKTKEMVLLKNIFELYGNEPFKKSKLISKDFFSFGTWNNLRTRRLIKKKGKERYYVHFKPKN